MRFPILRSLPSHSPRRHFSKSSSSPNALQVFYPPISKMMKKVFFVKGSNMQSNHRQSRRHLRRQKKKKHRGPSRSYSHSHLNHVHPQYSMPVQNNRYQPQFNAHMPHFPQTIQMQTFVPPPQLLQVTLFFSSSLERNFSHASVREKGLFFS